MNEEQTKEKEGTRKTKEFAVTTAALKSLVEKTEPFVDETLLDIGDGKLYVRWVDPAHVGMGRLTVDVPELKGEDNKKTLIDTGDLKRMLQPWNIGNRKQRKNAEPEYMFQMRHIEEINESYANRRVLRFQNPDVWFTMGTLDPRDISEPKIPKLDLSATVVVDRLKVQKIIKMIEKVSDALVINIDTDTDTDEKKVTMYSHDEPDATNTAGGDITPKNKKLLKIHDEPADKTGCIQSIYSIDYFKDMVKNLKGETITFHLGTDYPLKMEWQEYTDEPNPVQGEYMLAPRIESD